MATSRQLFPNGWEIPSSSCSWLGWSSRGHPHTWSHRSSSHRFTWSSLLPTFIESLALSLQYTVHRARWSWTSPARWSPGPGLEPEMYARQCLMHWCTCYMDALAVCATASAAPEHEALHLPGLFSSPDFFTWRNLLPPAPRAAAAPPQQPVRFLAEPAPTWTPAQTRLSLYIILSISFFLIWLFNQLEAYSYACVLPTTFTWISLKT